MSRTPTSPVARTRLTPSLTTRSASTSRPESVSSRMATFGLSSSSWRISWRFFSPPEKPSFTLRSANEESMRSCSIAVRTSFDQVRSLGAWPSMAVLAVRRKFETVTPGTSTGYCIARKSPARARSSTVMASTSSPSSVTVPVVIVYLGWPAMEYASVDLPEPFGPMIACVSPEWTVRSTPRRISFVVCSAVTATCRSRISRMAMMCACSLSVAGVAGDRHVHEDVVTVDGHGVDGHGPDRGERGRLARAQVEAGTVEPALDRAVLHLALRQGHLGMAARVADGVHVPLLVTDDRDRDAAEDDLDGADVGQVGEPQRALGAHAVTSASVAASIPITAAAPTEAVSSASIEAISRCSTSGTPIRWTSSTKNPRTTSRRASISGIPRACR